MFVGRGFRRQTRVVVYGAGHAGVSLARSLKESSAIRYEPVGFIHDESGKIGRRIHGVPVIGGREDLC